METKRQCFDRKMFANINRFVKLSYGISIESVKTVDSYIDKIYILTSRQKNVQRTVCSSKVKTEFFVIEKHVKHIL